MARCTRAATTEESTPPDRAQITLSVPTLARISATVVSMKECMVQSGRQPQRPKMKLRRISVPLIGTDILRHFIFGLCGCRPDWTMHSFIDTTVADIRTKVGTDKVICALSGGVDSSVVAALVHRAIGAQLTCIYVNNGLMRTGESESVLRFFREKTHLNVIDVDAADFFLKSLDGIKDPEEKRKRIGYGFIEIFEEEARKLGTVRYLAQGTLYPCLLYTSP